MKDISMVGKVAVSFLLAGSLLGGSAMAAGKEKARAAEAPNNKKAQYTVTFYYSGASNINLTRTYKQCMLNPGPSSITVQPFIPNAIGLKDDDGFPNCNGGAKFVTWNPYGGQGNKDITFQHEKGNDGNWKTQIMDTTGMVKAAICLDADTEQNLHCLNNQVGGDIISVDISF